ncbi:hypothetical protein EST38_g758 [Candolleomyces aberdarensis]|uniref:DUF6534 domain-containing protein n=1 Tax=Candolleomyces aberdarensis TaxID=2316362 RepID=A0A4Q2DX69_9AGAR|nr:hypothetical protein EST38_g758 [Candolleomyces aberdarensis]
MADDSVVLLGAFAMQVYHYYMNYAHSDRPFFVVLVCVVVAIEIAHMCMATHLTYYVLALGYTNPRVFEQTPWSGAALPAVNGLVGLCTQVFFAWRIATVTSATDALKAGRVASGVILLTGVMQCAAAFAVTIQYSFLSRQLLLLRTLKTTVIVWLAGSFTCDTIITVTMVVLLLRARGNMSFRGSRNMMNALIIHSVENGAITTFCALIDLLTFLLLPDTLYYACFEYLLGRLYANVLMATLNGRNRMREIGEPSMTEDFELALGKSTRKTPPEVSQVQFRVSFGSEDDNVDEYELKTRTQGSATFCSDRGSQFDEDVSAKGRGDQYPCQ